jgi:hypothetical protein
VISVACACRRPGRKPKRDHRRRHLGDPGSIVKRAPYALTRQRLVGSVDDQIGTLKGIVRTETDTSATPRVRCVRPRQNGVVRQISAG